MDVVYDIFFVGRTSKAVAGNPTDRAKAIDDPDFCHFMQMIRDRTSLEKVARIYRQTWTKMDEYVAEEAAATADEVFGHLPHDSRAIRVPDVYTNFFAREGDSFVEDEIYADDQTQQQQQDVDLSTHSDRCPGAHCQALPTPTPSGKVFNDQGELTSFLFKDEYDQETLDAARDAGVEIITGTFEYPPMPELPSYRPHPVSEEGLAAPGPGVVTTISPASFANLPKPVIGDNIPTVPTDEETGGYSRSTSDTSDDASIVHNSNETGSDEGDEDCCWACLKCTFRNSLEKRRCGACNALRPARYYI